MVLLCGGVQSVNAQRYIGDVRLPTMEEVNRGRKPSNPPPTYIPSDPPKPEPKPEYYCSETRTYYWTKEARDNAKSEYLRAEAAETKRKADEEAESRRIETERVQAVVANTMSQVKGYEPIAPTPELKRVMPTGGASNVSSVSNTKSIAGNGIPLYTPNSKTPKENTVYKNDHGYSLLCGIAADNTGRAFPLSEGEYLDCIVNTRNWNAPDCREAKREYQQFWHGIISKDPAYTLYQDMLADLAEAGIDIAAEAFSISVALAFGPGAFFAKAGFGSGGKFAAELAKAVIRGESLESSQVWLKAAIAAMGAVGTGNKALDIVVKTSTTMAGEYIKGKKTEVILTQGGETLIIQCITASITTYTQTFVKNENSKELVKEGTKLALKGVKRGILQYDNKGYFLINPEENHTVRFLSSILPE